MVRALLLLACAGCAGAAIDPVRFRNQPPVWRVDDQRDIAKPRDVPYTQNLYFFDAFVVRRLTRLMEVPEPSHARDVNSLDEVPDSTWFTNRIGVRPLTPDDIRRGPNRVTGPDPSQPWKVFSSKVGGTAPGLFIEDARGIRFVMKFDNPGIPDLQTGGDVVVQRLLWAIGYHVPEDNVVHFRREQIVLGPKAKVSDPYGHSRKMTEHDLDLVFTQIDRRPSGDYRAQASRFIEGSLLCCYQPEGVRPDDPNDHVPHEDRRSVRGQSVIFGWLAHTDVKPDNTKDTYIADPADPKRHYLMHYLIDFGEALGGMATTDHVATDGFAHFVDVEYMGLSALALGLWKRPWEGAVDPGIRGVGRFESDRYDPARPRPRYPYVPFARADDLDGFWAAKIIMRFTADQIRAAAEMGRYEDPRAVEYLTGTLVARQRKLGRYWYSRVAPLDGFTIDAGGSLCFDDLWLAQGFGSDGGHRVAAVDFDGRATGFTADLAPAAHACLSIPLARDHEGYTVVEIRTARASGPMPPVYVHLARDPANGAPRVIGLRRMSK